MIRNDKYNNNYLYIVWKDVKSRRQYVVAKLEKKNGFNFYYCEEINQAIKAGFTPLVGFPDINKKYYSDKMFLPFSSRLPDKKRKDISDILEKYGLNEYDEYNLLKKSRGKLPIDNIQFIEPLFITDTAFDKDFFLAGVRHYLGCEGVSCRNIINIVRGDELFLQMEPNNKEDIYAIKVIDDMCKCVGYIPRYFAEGYTKILQQGREVTCHVIAVNKDNNCDDCIKVMVSVKER